MMPKTILFLCTGNYYRSRFAEILFNALAAAQCPEYVAISRGLADDLSLNPGPISAFALVGLAERNIAPPAEHRYPLPLQLAELEQAARIIALYEAEHRPLLERRFPEWTDRVEYWQVPDLDKATHQVALADIEAHVRHMIQELVTFNEVR
jgi:protein-tyrosine phosphatase